MHQHCLEGCRKLDVAGRDKDGCTAVSLGATIRWSIARAANLRLLEVRGRLAEQATRRMGVSERPRSQRLLAQKRTTFRVHDPHEQRGLTQSWVYALVEDVHAAATLDSFPATKSDCGTSYSNVGSKGGGVGWSPTVFAESQSLLHLRSRLRQAGSGTKQ